MPFTGPGSKPAYTVRGGGVGNDGAGPGCMPIGRGRSGGGVRLRPVSGVGGWWRIAQRGRSERGTGGGTGSGRVPKAG